MPRISQIAVQVIYLDEHDAPQQEQPTVLAGGPDGTALEKAQAFLAQLAPPKE